MNLQGQLFTDASAALGIVSRTGIGKVRHTRTHALWLQECRQGRRLQFTKIPGAESPADAGTKHMSEDMLGQHLVTMGVEWASGRAASAPGLSSLEALPVTNLRAREPQIRREAEGVSGRAKDASDSPSPRLRPQTCREAGRGKGARADAESRDELDAVPSGQDTPSRRPEPTHRCCPCDADVAPGAGPTAEHRGTRGVNGELGYDSGVGEEKGSGTDPALCPPRTARPPKPMSATDDDNIGSLFVVFYIAVILQTLLMLLEFGATLDMS